MQARPNLNARQPLYPRKTQQRFAKSYDLDLLKEDFDPDRDIPVLGPNPCYDPPRSPARPEKPLTKIDTKGMDRIVQQADNRRGRRYQPPALTLPPNLVQALEMAVLLSAPAHAAAYARGDYF